MYTYPLTALHSAERPLRIPGQPTKLSQASLDLHQITRFLRIQERIHDVTPARALRCLIERNPTPLVAQNYVSKTSINHVPCADLAEEPREEPEL
jgi:hypothetical protein